MGESPDPAGGGRRTGRVQTIAIHPAAPSKPVLGQACNGCGVCCLAEPCPVGIVVSRRRSGPCKAVVWSEAESRYRCGVVTDPSKFLPRWLLGLGKGTERAAVRMALRLIAAGRGCDSDATIE